MVNKRLVKDARKEINLKNFKPGRKKTKPHNSNEKELKKAKQIRDELVEKIGFDGNLIKFGINDSDLWTDSNSCLGLLYAADKFKKAL